MMTKSKIAVHSVHIRLPPAELLTSASNVTSISRHGNQDATGGF